MASSIDKEWQKLGSLLEVHHALFYKFWQLGKPSFTNSIDTAAILFDKEGNFVNFLFNEKFWDSCDEYKKLFVICHECLHVILNHGSRFKDCKEFGIANVAQDIAINHLLVDGFGFVKEQIEDWEKYCWVDTVFKNKKVFGLPYPTDESSEFYYNNLLKEQEKKKNNSGQGSGQGSKGEEESDQGSSGNSGEQSDLPKTVDDHSTWNEGKDDLEMIEKVMDSLSPEEIESLTEKLKNQVEKALKAGTAPLCMPFLVKRPAKIVPKKKWETVIKKWESMVTKIEEHECEQWIRKPRRMSCISTDMFIPSDEEVEDITRKKDKINVFFFLDTSGSCFHLAERFFKAALTLNPKKFNIRLFCFDHAVVETDIKGQQLYGGGGTSFSAIENKIQEIIKKSGEKYPHAVFLITDGYGNKVVPQFPKRWHWFLSENHTNFIPKESQKYMLKDFE